MGKWVTVTPDSITEGTNTTKELNNQFETVLYTGDNTNKTINLNNIVNGVDFVWIKDREAGNSSAIFDSTRGIGTNGLSSDTTSEETAGLWGQLTNFGTSSFSYEAGSSGLARVGESRNYVAWCASLPNDFSYTADELGAGTLAVSGKSNDFMSVVSYISDAGTGLLYGHGLNRKPDLVIQKARTSGPTSLQWHVNTDVIDGSNDLLYLEQTAAKFDLGWTMADDTKFASNSITAGHPMIAYAFTSVPGLCKVGSYTGNQTTTPVVECGFEPQWIMIKRSDLAGEWVLIDNQRGENLALYPHLPNADNSGYDASFDFNATGFSIAGTFNELNAIGGTYIYLAIAKNSDVIKPKFVADLTTAAPTGIPTDARILDRSVTPAATKTYNGDGTFTYTYGAVVKDGHAMNRKLTCTKSGTTVAENLTSVVKKAL